MCLDHFCVEFKKKKNSTDYLGDRFKVYNTGAVKPQSYYELENEVSVYDGVCKKGWHQRNIEDFPFNWPILEREIEGCYPTSVKFRIEMEGSISYEWIMTNTMAVILGDDVPEDDKRREFRVALDNRKKCDPYFLFKYAIEPDTFRYWERTEIRRGGKPSGGELVQGKSMKCPFEVDDEADAYDAKEQTFKVQWKV